MWSTADPFQGPAVFITPADVAASFAERYAALGDEFPHSLAVFQVWGRGRPMTSSYDVSTGRRFNYKYISLLLLDSDIDVDFPTPSAAGLLPGIFRLAAQAKSAPNSWLLLLIYILENPVVIGQNTRFTQYKKDFTSIYHRRLFGLGRSRLEC